MTLDVPLVAVAGMATFLAVRWRASARAERLAARLARERQAGLGASLRRLGTAARRSAGEVRAELAAALRALVPAVDSVLVFDDEDGVLVCTFAAGDRVAYFAGARLGRDQSDLLPVRALAAAHRVGAEDGGRTFHPADRFALAVPLLDGRGVTSVVYVAAAAEVAAEEREALVALIDHAGFVYGLALERERDRRRAEYDGLTGLLTPRALRERLSELIERTRLRPGPRLALVFVDTDRFKQWNDICGHASGDALLRALARVLRTALVDPDDVAARNGGDEFCLVFAGEEKSGAVRRAERVRDQIAGMDFAALRPPGVGDDVFVTASIGVAAYPVDADDAAALLEAADAAMYAVKRAGRNATAYYDVDGQPALANAPQLA